MPGIAAGSEASSLARVISRIAARVVTGVLTRVVARIVTGVLTRFVTRVAGWTVARVTRVEGRLGRTIWHDGRNVSGAIWSQWLKPTVVQPNDPVHFCR